MSEATENASLFFMHQAVEVESSGRVLRAKIVTMDVNAVVLKLLDPVDLKQGEVMNMRPGQDAEDRRSVPVKVEWTLETQIDRLAKVFLPFEPPRTDRRLFLRIQLTCDFIIWRGIGDPMNEFEGRASNVSAGGMEGMIHRSIDLYPMEVVRFKLPLPHFSLAGDARVLRVFAAGEVNRIAFSFERMEDQERVLLVQMIQSIASQTPAKA